jgi:hypothetical protein
MDYLTGKILNALSKGCTEAINIGIDSLKLPDPIKKFANKSLTNVDEMVEESLVLSKMDRKFDDVQPKAVTAVPRPDATPKKVDPKKDAEAATLQGEY